MFKVLLNILILALTMQVASATCTDWTSDGCSWFGIDGCPSNSYCDGTLGWGQCRCEGGRQWIDGSCGYCGSFEECRDGTCRYKSGDCNECPQPQQECSSGSCVWSSTYCGATSDCGSNQFCDRSGGSSYGRCVDNVDCVVQISECTAACETASQRTVTVTTPQSGQGASCAVATDCLHGDGQCFTNEPTLNPTGCPTPDMGGGLIDVTTSEVQPNGRVLLDFRYSYVVSEFEIAMNTNIYSYSAESPNDWNADTDMCIGYINRVFTYNELQASVEFTVENGDVYFAVDSAFEYTTMEQTTVDGVTHEWGQTVKREKDLPFKLHVPETSTLAIGVTSNQEDPNPDDFIYPPPATKSPSTSYPTTSPTFSTPSAAPTDLPTLSNPSVVPTDMPSVSDPTVTPTDTPSISTPTSSPTFEEPTLSPSVSEPTLDPSLSPTKNPSYTDPTISPSFTDPSLSPSYTDPSLSPTSDVPSWSPTPAANVLATVVAALAEETRQIGANPLVDITYTTVIKMPWALTNPAAEGNAIAETPTYNEVTSGSCDTFTDLPAFLQSPNFYCQTWHIQFGGDRRCTTEPRTVQVGYTATNARGGSEAVDFSWDFDLGFSSAFDCSEDLGSFQIAIIVEGSSGGNDNFADPGDAYLDDWYFFRIGVSSGAPVTAVNIVDLQILSAQGEPLCEDCESIEALQIGVSDYSPDNFIVQLILDSSIFGGHLSTQMEFTFDITMSTGERRRLLASQTATEKISLYLQRPNRYRGRQEIASERPTAVNPYPPTPKPVEAVKQAASKDLVSAQDSSGSANIIYIAIGAVFLLGVAFAGAYYMRSKESTEDVVDFTPTAGEGVVTVLPNESLYGGAELVEIS